MFEHFWESFVQPGMTFKLGVCGGILPNPNVHFGANASSSYEVEAYTSSHNAPSAFQEPISS